MSDGTIGKGVGVQSTELRLKRKFQLCNCRKRPTQFNRRGRAMKEFCDPPHTAGRPIFSARVERANESNDRGDLPLFG